MLALIMLLAFAVMPIEASAQVPPQILAIQQKIQSGQPLSDDDRNTLQQWAKSMHPGGAMRGGSGMPQNHGHYHLGPSTSEPLDPPTASEYQRLVREAIRTYGDQAQDMRAPIEAQFAQNPGRKSDASLGFLMLASSSGAASVFAFAKAADRYPDDAVIAGNLGAALHIVGDDENALKALLYANSLTPGSPTILTSLGWTLTSLGDYTDAYEFFNEAVNQAPRFGMAELGLGFYLQCHGQHLEAVAHLRRALGGGAALKLTEVALADAETDAAAQEKLLLQSAPPGARGGNASPVVVGPIGSLSDFSADLPSVSGPMAAFPAVFPTDTIDDAEAAQNFFTEQHEAAQHAQHANNWAFRAAYTRTRMVTGDTITYPLNPWGKYILAAEIGKYYRPKFAQDAALRNHALNDGQAVWQSQNDQMTHENLSDQEAAAAVLKQYDLAYEAVLPGWRIFWAVKEADLIQFYKDDTEVLSEIPDDAARLEAFLGMEYQITGEYESDWGVSGVHPRLPPGYESFEQRAGSPPSADAKPIVINPPLAEPNAMSDIPANFKLKFAAYSVTLSSDEVEFELEAPDASTRYDFNPEDKDGAYTMLFGISDEDRETFGLDAAKTGIYVTYDALSGQGQFSDVGFKGELTAGTGNHADEAGVNLVGGPTATFESTKVFSPGPPE